MAKGEHWDRVADVWEQRVRTHIDEVDPYGAVAMDGLPLADGWSILDIGCGPGATTLELVERAGPTAQVTGIDISESMIHHARQRAGRATESGDVAPHSVSFRVADAEHDDLGTGHDVAFSRFGVMFFDDPAVGFANIARALRPDGWLSVVAWARAEDNPWMPLATQAAASTFGVEVDPPPASGGPGPFSLADTAATIRLLVDAGFDRLDVVDITQERRIRHGAEKTWISLALRTGPLADAYDAADDETRSGATEAVIASMEKYRQPGPTGDWLIPAHARAFIGRRTS